MLYKDSLLFTIISIWLVKLQNPLRDSKANEIKEKLHQALTNLHENILPAFESKKFPGIFALRHGWKLYKSFSDLHSNPLMMSYFRANGFLENFKTQIASAEPASIEAKALQTIACWFPEQPRQNEIKFIFLKLHQASTSKFIELFSKEVYKNLSPELEELRLDMIRDLKKLPKHLHQLFPGVNHEEFFSKFLAKIPFVKLPQILHLTLENYPELSTRGYSTMTYLINITLETYANNQCIKVVDLVPEPLELGVIYLLHSDTTFDMRYHFKPDSQSTQTGSIRIEDRSSDDAFFRACLSAIQAQGHAKTVVFDAEEAYQKFKEKLEPPTPASTPRSTLESSIEAPVEAMQALKTSIKEKIKANNKQLSRCNREIQGLLQQKDNLLTLQSRILQAQESQIFSPNKACIEMTSSLISLDQKTKQWLENEHKNLSSREKPKFFRYLQATQDAILQQLEHVEHILRSCIEEKNTIEGEQIALKCLKDKANSLNNTLLQALDNPTWGGFKIPLEKWMDAHFEIEIIKAKQNFLTDLQSPEDFNHLRHANTPSLMQEQYEDLQIACDYLSNPNQDLTIMLTKIHDGEIKKKILDIHLQTQYQRANDYYHRKDYSSIISTICFIPAEVEIDPEVQEFSENLQQVLSDMPTKFTLSKAAQDCIKRIKEDVNEWKKTQEPFNPQNYHCFQLKIKSRLYQIQKDYTKNPNWTIVMNIVIGLLTLGIAHAIKYCCSNHANSLDRLSFFRPQAFTNTLNTLEDTFAKSPLNQNP